MDVGVRSFKVKLEDDGIDVLRSKVIQGSVIHKSSQTTPDNTNSLPFAPPSRSSLHSSKADRGKGILSQSLVDDNPDETVECSSGLGHSTRIDSCESLEAIPQPPSDQALAGITGSSSASREKPDDGDILLPCSGNMLAGCSSAVSLPRDGDSTILFGTMHSFLLPCDYISQDSSNISNQILSHDPLIKSRDVNSSNKHSRDQESDSIPPINSDQMSCDKHPSLIITPSSTMESLPRDTHISDHSSTDDLMPQDEQTSDLSHPSSLKNQLPRDRLPPSTTLEPIKSCNSELVSEPIIPGNTSSSSKKDSPYPILSDSLI